MLAGVNDGYAQAVQLAQILDPKIYKLNLIPYNPTDSIYDGSSRNAIDAFRAALEEHGLRATVRLTRGRDIDAACGQLAAKTPGFTGVDVTQHVAGRVVGAQGHERPARSSPSPRSRSRRRLAEPIGASALGVRAAEQLPAGDLGRRRSSSRGR